jgi:hypothetical protein
MARSIRLLVVYAEELEWRIIPRAFQSGGEIPLREEPGRRSAKPSAEDCSDFCSDPTCRQPHSRTPGHIPPETLNLNFSIE